uniref:Acid-sensing ion channel 1-like n=2 Tax=Macrostomum lignano TaxID=282301 RepID=A0A1I8HFN4_9PLAT
MRIEDAESGEFYRNQTQSPPPPPKPQASLTRGAKLVLAEWLCSTSTHGVGQCVKSQSIAGRLLWLLLIGGCLGFSAWHLAKLMSQYVNFPTTMSMSEVNVPATLPDVVLCNSDLVSAYRLSLLNVSARAELESAYARYLNVCLKAGADKGQVSYTSHFKRLFYRLPITASIRPQLQDVIVGFTYGDQLEGGCFDFRSYLADVNDRLMICYRLILRDVIHRMQLNSVPFSQEVLKLLLFKRPRAGNTFSSFFDTDWAKNQALKLLLQESGEDALQLFFVDGTDAINSQTALGTKSLHLTHGRHYDVQVSQVMYENSDPSDCVTDTIYQVEDVLSNFPINYSRSNCQAKICAKKITADLNCYHSGTIVFT